MKIRVTFEAHRREFLRVAGERKAVTFQWPTGLPLPAVGDELIWHGSPVTVVERNGPDVERIIAGEAPDEDDRHYTLRWMDRRYEPDPFVPAERRERPE